MLIYFYGFDGVTPVTDNRTVMVGGTQEDPVLGTKSNHMVCTCPGRKVGDTFELTYNDGWSKSKFLVFEEGKAKKVF